MFEVLEKNLVVCYEFIPAEMSLNALSGVEQGIKELSQFALNVDVGRLSYVHDFLVLWDVCWLLTRGHGSQFLAEAALPTVQLLVDCDI